MSSTDTSATTTITPAALLERLVARRPTTLLDVREDVTWAIAGPSVEIRNVQAVEAVGRARELAAELPHDAVVVCNRGISARVVAEELWKAGATAQVLSGGMRGWIDVLRAFPVEVGVDGLTLLQIHRPGRGCLSYLVVAGGAALVVDPAPDVRFYLDLARRLDATIETVLDTHLHADHLSGARELAARSGATLRLPQATFERLAPDRREAVALRDGEAVALGDADIVALALPGHTTDMTGLLVAGRALLSGDSLFADGIARPDLQAGDGDPAREMARTLHATLHERILSLAPATVLLGGHDSAVVRTAAVAPTLAQVRARVPELVETDPDAFADELLSAMPPAPANHEQIVAANAGRAHPDPTLETGGNSCAAR